MSLLSPPQTAVGRRRWGHRHRAARRVSGRARRAGRPAPPRQPAAPPAPRPALGDAFAPAPPRPRPPPSKPKRPQKQFSGLQTRCGGPHSRLRMTTSRFLGVRRIGLECTLETVARVEEFLEQAGANGKTGSAPDPPLPPPGSMSHGVYFRLCLLGKLTCQEGVKEGVKVPSGFSFLLHQLYLP